MPLHAFQGSQQQIWTEIWGNSIFTLIYDYLLSPKVLHQLQVTFDW